ncbi:P22 phage major capsid protein family protein [Actinomyces procaprae]|uniref:P22 phage major capsid protein family protein n=1 Tax=Actinomyces procaprae TaxID=2560010 RepID=UPI0010A24B89|nr:P22 phage major capsid protein family protein [Actinomyces procaprae]
MAHTLYTPEQAASSTLAALRYLTNLPRTVRMDFAGEFVAGRGQTVNVKGPISAGTANIYTPTNRQARDEITFNDLTQTWIPVKLENQIYNAVRLPDDWATFTLSSLEQEVLIPQAESVVDQLADPLLEEMRAIKAPTASGTGADVTYNAGTALKFAADGTDALKVIARLRKVLNDRKVPTQGRTLAVGSAIAALLLTNETLVQAHSAGTTETLRQATIGTIYGFTIVEEAALPEDFAIAYNRDAFAFVTRPSRKPEGAAYGATVAKDGFSLRHIMHYNPLQLEDQSIVDTFFGAATLDAKRAVSCGLAAGD